MSKEARVIFNILFIGSAVGAGLYLSRGPWKVYRTQKAQADQAQSRMVSAEREHAQLAHDSAEAESEAGKELIARQHGYLKPGEQRVDVNP